MAMGINQFRSPADPKGMAASTGHSQQELERLRSIMTQQSQNLHYGVHQSPTHLIPPFHRERSLQHGSQSRPMMGISPSPNALPQHQPSFQLDHPTLSTVDRSGQRGEQKRSSEVDLAYAKLLSELHQQSPGSFSQPAAGLESHVQTAHPRHVQFEQGQLEALQHPPSMVLPQHEPLEQARLQAPPHELQHAPGIQPPSPRFHSGYQSTDFMHMRVPKTPDRAYHGWDFMKYLPDNAVSQHHAPGSVLHEPSQVPNMQPPAPTEGPGWKVYEFHDPRRKQAGQGQLRYNPPP